MPLAFASLSHGTVAFGFFNIETDMLLLDRVFFFARDFCEAVVSVAGAGATTARAGFEGFRIEQKRDVGDLHGAIAGVDLSGFIGATYALRPFPTREQDFRQNPEPGLSCDEVTSMIARFGRKETLELSRDEEGRIFTLAGIRFDRQGFFGLVSYVDRGGWPRWRDETRPSYVKAMMEALRDGPGWSLDRT